jgi:hypothetical protein
MAMPYTVMTAGWEDVSLTDALALHATLPPLGSAAGALAPGAVK